MNGDISAIATGQGTYGIKDAVAREQRTTFKIFDGDPYKADLSVIKLSSDEYEQLVAGGGVLLSDALYIVEGENEDMYGQRVTNVGWPVDLSDAVTKQYVDSKFLSAVPTSRKVNNKQLTADITLTASDVGALPSTTTHTAGDVPTSRKVNNKQLTADITLNASDVGAVPTTRTINGQQLTGDITIQTGGAYLPLSVQAGDTVVDFDGGGDGQNRRLVFKRKDKAIIVNSERTSDNDDYIWLELSGSSNGIVLNDGAFNEFLSGSYLQMDGDSYAEFQSGSYAKLAGARLIVDNNGQIQISSGYVVCKGSANTGIWMMNPSKVLIEDWSQISVRSQDDDLKKRLEAFESRISALEGQVSALCAELSAKTAVTINRW